MTPLTSRERMLRSLQNRDVDYIPCCFMSFTALRKRCQEDLYELVKAEQALGLDSLLFIPGASRPQRPEHPDLRGLPLQFSPAVTSRQWHGKGPGGGDFLYREYSTPAGKLSTGVQLTEDWTHGNYLPFVDDFQIPRAVKPLISMPSELDALRCLLLPPDEEDKISYALEARRAHDFAAAQGVLLVGGWGVGMDMANWLCGMQELMVLSMEQPAFVSQLLEMIHAWNMQRMALVLSAPVDLYIRRAWYEGCDFVTPRFFRKEILPRLKAEVDLAHEHGALFGYICSSGTKPMLDAYLEAGIDTLIAVDPIQGTHTDLPLMKQKIGPRVCLWGGVCGAITVEMGSEAEVRSAVRAAVDTLGPRGFILSPVDNITVDAPLTWRNIDILIGEWRKTRGG